MLNDPGHKLGWIWFNDATQHPLDDSKKKKTTLDTAVIMIKGSKKITLKTPSGHYFQDKPLNCRFVNGAPECAVCVNFLVEPLTLQCGHSFCRVCVLSCLKLSPQGEKCPLCRSKIDIHNPDNFFVDSSMLRIVKSTVTIREYSMRLKSDIERIEHLTSGEENMPIMVLNRPLELGEMLPLHICSSRYKILIRRVWSGNRLFIYSPFSPLNGSKALIMRVEHALFSPDGKAHVFVRCVKEVVIGMVWIEMGTCGLKFTRLNKTLLNIKEEDIPDPPSATFAASKCGACCLM
jgi:hypothetical protein